MLTFNVFLKLTQCKGIVFPKTQVNNIARHQPHQPICGVTVINNVGGGQAMETDFEIGLSLLMC